MAMIEGTVTINPDTGAADSDGCAGEVFDVIDAAQYYDVAGGTKPQFYGGVTGETLAAARENVAVLARAIAKVIPHITNNGKAKITTGDAGLQLIPATLNEDDPCKAPAATKLLALE